MPASYKRVIGSYSRWTIWICAAAAALSIALLGGLLVFALPTGDDFCYAGMHLRDVWPFVVHVYQQQGGRWSAAAAEAITAALIPGIVGFYPAILAALLAFRIACAYALARAVLDPSLSRTRCFFAAASFCLLYWCAMPSIGDSAYWMTGAFFYELPASGIMLFLAALWSQPLTALRALGLGAAAILLTGTNEVAALAILAVVAAGFVFALIVKEETQRSPDRAGWLLLSILTLAGVVVALAAPGNFVRAGHLGETHQVSRTLFVAGKVLLGRVPRWVLDAPLLLACAAVLVDPGLHLKPEWTAHRRILRAVLAVAAAGVSILAGFLISAWASGGVMPGRLLNWLYVILLSTLLGSALLLKPVWIHPRWLRSLILAAAFVAMAVGNPRLAALDLASRVPPWSAAKRAALRELSQGNPAFPPLPEYPHLYFDYDVNPDPSSHPNVCLARYYGLPSVTGPRPLGMPDGAALSGRLYGRP